MTAGPSQTIRDSLANAAVLAVSGETEAPAPATWATSWIDRPKNTPAWWAVRPRALASGG